jgi:hypothetical protein
VVNRAILLGDLGWNLAPQLLVAGLVGLSGCAESGRSTGVVEQQPESGTVRFMDAGQSLGDADALPGFDDGDGSDWPLDDGLESDWPLDDGLEVGADIGSTQSALTATGAWSILSTQHIKNATHETYYNIDSPISTFINGTDGFRYWIYPFVVWSRAELPTVYHTTVRVPYSSGYDLNTGTVVAKLSQTEMFYAPCPGRCWLASVYQVNSTPVELLAFVHVEWAEWPEHKGQWRQIIGIAYFHEGWYNNKWLYLQDAIKIQGYTDQTGTSLDEIFNITGAPYLVKDGYIYVYYKELYPQFGNAVARAPLATLITNARAAAPTTFHKYCSSGWGHANCVGMEGQWSPLTSIFAGVILHAGAIKLLGTNRYYLSTTTQQQAGAYTWNKIYSSTDLLNWVKEYEEASFTSAKVGFQYVTEPPRVLRRLGCLSQAAFSRAA